VYAVGPTAADDVIALAASGRVVYGVNTGCGPLCARPVPLAEAARFQRNLVLSHATGLGPAHPPRVARATMALRAHSLAQGRSAVRPLVVETLVALLNAGVHAVIPTVGSVSASGDLVELAHVARLLLGDGPAEVGGERRPAAAALAAAGLAPLAFEGREALALMNGTSCETAQAALLVLDAETLVAAAEAAAAVAIELVAAAEAADLAGHAGMAAGTRAVVAAVRRHVPPVVADRPLGDVVERLAAHLDDLAAVAGG
jgi:histidine ammonia-lyase